MEQGLVHRTARRPRGSSRKFGLHDLKRALDNLAPGNRISMSSLSAYWNGKTVPVGRTTELLAACLFKDDEAQRKRFCAEISGERIRSKPASDPWKSLRRGDARISVGIVESGPLAVSSMSGSERSEGFFDFLLNRTGIYSALPFDFVSSDIVTAVTGRSFHLACPLLECPDRTRVLRFFSTPVRISVAAVAFSSTGDDGFADRIGRALRTLSTRSMIDLSDGDLVVADVEIGGLFVLQAMHSFENSGVRIVRVKQGQLDEYVRCLKGGRPAVAVLDEYSAVALLQRLGSGGRLLIEPWSDHFRPGQRRLPSYPLGFATARHQGAWTDYFAHALERTLEAEMDLVVWAYARLWAELVWDLSAVVPRDRSPGPTRSYPAVLLQSRTAGQLARAEQWADRVVGFSRHIPESSRYLAAAIWREILTLAADQRPSALDELAAALPLLGAALSKEA
jgi:hypothetical protein